MPTIITGARTEQPLQESPAAATLITRADIERSQAASLVELLAQQPGVEFARTGGPGSQASLFLRGAESSQTLVLVDGVRLNTVTSGAAVLGAVTLDSIDRIEIVRGNLSSLYGSEAIGGVVQIFTRGSGQPGAQLAAEVGSGATRSASARANGGGAGDGLRWSASVGARSSAPFSAIDTARVTNANPDIDGTRQQSASLGLSQRFGGTELSASAWSQRNRTDFDSGSDGPTVTHRERGSNDVWQLAVKQAVSARASVAAALADTRTTSLNVASDPASFNNGEFGARNRQMNLVFETRLAQGWSARAGGERLDQRGASTGYDPNFGGVNTAFNRSVDSAWVGLTGRSAPHQLQANLRRDEYSDVGGATTGLLSYGYALTRALRVVATTSTAFRAPSFNDLYYFGNPALKPEWARSAELGLRYAEGAWRADASVFRTRTRDLIRFVSTPSGGQPENVARALAEGVELALGWQRDGWRANANATLLRAEDESTGQRLLRRAPRAFNVGVFHDAAAWGAGAMWSRTGPRQDFDALTFDRTVLPAYDLLRLVAHVDLDRRTRLTARLENALDRRYALVDGYNTWGRAVFAGVQWRL